MRKQLMAAALAAGLIVSGIAAPASAATQTTAAATQTIGVAAAKKFVKPKITTQPKAVTVTQGNNATFKVKATGTNLRYEWLFRYKGKKTWYYFQKGKRATGVLKNAEVADNGGSVRVIITNQKGKTTSKTVKLTVKKVAKPTIITQITSATVTQGNNATFKVKATGTNLRYEWLFRYKGKKTWYYFQKGKSAAGLLKNAEVADNGGSVRVVITNKGGKAVSKTVRLTVNKASTPRINMPKDLYVNSAKDTSVVLKGSGFKDVKNVRFESFGSTFAISYGSQNLKFSKTDSNITITIPNAAGAYTGILTVESINGVDTKQVLYSPAITKSERAHLVAEYNINVIDYGQPHSRVKAEVDRAIRYIKSAEALSTPARNAGFVISNGYSYTSSVRQVAQHQAALNTPETYPGEHKHHQTMIEYEKSFQVHDLERIEEHGNGF